MSAAQQTPAEARIGKHARAAAPDSWTYARVSGALALLRSVTSAGADDSGTWEDALLIHEAQLARIFRGSRAFGERPKACIGDVKSRIRDLETLGLVVTAPSRRKGILALAPSTLLLALVRGEAQEVAA